MRGPTAQSRRIRVLALGGSTGHYGGLEAFCRRSQDALAQLDQFEVVSKKTESAHMSLRRLPAFLRALGALIPASRQGYDCAWIQYASLPDLAYAVVARLLGMRVLVTPHLGREWRSQTNMLLRRLGDISLGAAHRLALISVTQEEDLRLPDRVPRSLIRTFLPPKAINGPMPQRRRPDQPLLLIHSSRLSVGKGTFLFVDLCAQLRAHGVSFEAKICGGADAATMARLDAEVRGHGMQDAVEVVGRLGEDELLALLGRSDVLIHLSRIDSYPLTVLEAMASGMFPICLELAGARNMIETYDGHIVGTERPVADTLEWLLAHDLEAVRDRGHRLSARVRADYAVPRCSEALARAIIACSSADTARTAPVDIYEKSL